MLFSLSLFLTQHCFSSFHLSTYHRHTHTIRHSVSLPNVASCHLTLQNTINTHTYKPSISSLLNIASHFLITTCYKHPHTTYHLVSLLNIAFHFLTFQPSTKTNIQSITQFLYLILLPIFPHYNSLQTHTYNLSPSSCILQPSGAGH